MNKITTFFLSFVVALLFVSCNQTSPSSVTASAADSLSHDCPTFAYVDMDTLQAHYAYYLDCRSELESIYSGYQATLTKKENALQAKVTEFQKKAQEGRFVSEVEFNNAQAALAKEQASLEQLGQKYMQQYAAKEAEYNKAISDSIQQFLTEYNAEHKYTMIFYRAVILHCDETLDITFDVLKGLNERYEAGK
jgi:outer membrane protein